MANWILEDSMLAPREKIEINFRGSNPFGIYKKMDSPYLQRTFEVGSSDTWEREFRWTAGSDPHPFFIRVFVHREFDMFTEGFFEILLQGRQPSDPSKEGNVKITLGGNLRTTFKLSTPFQQTPIYRGLLWVYNYLYYWRVRRGYLKICQEKIDLLSREIRSWAGMPAERL